MLRAILLGLLVAASALGQEESAEKIPIRRTVAGQSVSSAQDPKVKLTFDRAFRYVGADRFNLYNVADAEVHVFVNADADKNVKRLYWVQFEEYFPNNQYKYDYSDNPVSEVAGWEWHVLARLRPADETVKPTSDTEHMLGILSGKGYKLQGTYGAIRLVHLTDETLRKELMIIYMEPAQGTIDEEALQQHAFARMKVEH